MHQDSLNRWTLKFIEKEIEDEYRAHFGDSFERQVQVKHPLVRHHQLNVRSCENQGNVHRPRYRYSGVFIDLLVSAIIFAVVATIMFVTVQPPKTPFIIFCVIASVFLLIVVGLIGFPLLSRKSILPCVHRWAPRHILGMIFDVLLVFNLLGPGTKSQN